MLVANNGFALAPSDLCPHLDHRSHRPLALRPPRQRIHHKEGIDQVGSLDELLYFCGLASDRLTQRLLEIHKLYDWQEFLAISEAELLDLRFGERAARLLVDGANLYLEKLNDCLFESSDSEDFRDYLP